MKKRLSVLLMLLAVSSVFSMKAYCSQDEIDPAQWIMEEDDTVNAFPAADIYGRPVTIEDILKEEINYSEISHQEVLGSKTIVKAESGNEYIRYDIKGVQLENAVSNDHYYFLDDTLQASVVEVESANEIDEGVFDMLKKLYGQPAPLSVDSLGEAAEVVRESAPLEDGQNSWFSAHAVITTRIEGKHAWLVLVRHEKAQEEPEQPGLSLNLEGLTEEEKVKVKEYLDFLKYEEIRQANAYIDYLKSLRKDAAAASESEAAFE